MSKKDQYQPYQIPGTLARYEPRLEMPWQQALLCIDLQVLGCREGYGVFESHRDAGISEHSIQYYLDRVDNYVIPNVQKLQAAFRKSGCEVIHCRIQSLTEDGRDRSLEHKRLGLHASPGSELAEFLPEVAPISNEIIINKTASGVFVSTNLEYILRNLGVQKLFVSGVYTNECVSSAVRSASDLGFDVRLISDATAAITRELHDATLLTTDQRYARVVTTSEALEELTIDE
ncbi:MAG: isochorismatase family cysteine hydrolase [Gammaproteobacteria bacterium]|nr:cysteine hydrolase [Pseudomonadales bacterium]MCP5348872.1 cysteine hydrolase [Pseudomonadales bacterium]